MTDQYDDKTNASVYIPIGGNLEIGITYQDSLVIQDRTGRQRLNLGEATKERFESLQDYLKRLSIHAVDA